MLAATSVFGIWIYLIGRQFLPLLMLAVCVSCFAALTYSIKGWLNRAPAFQALIIGACIGYFSSIVAAAVVTFVIYGSDQFANRFFPSSLYVYPLASLGWLYGSTMIALLKFVSKKRAEDLPGGRGQVHLS